MTRSTAGDNHHRSVDPRIWRACAGASVQIPLLYSRVYYFPQGHVEHCCPFLLPVIPPSTSPIPCFISSFRLLVDPITDEVLVHLSLQPMPLTEEFASMNLPRQENDADNDNNKLTSFAKILTPSDANNGGGFSVPRLCALSVFPPLDDLQKDDLPAQNLSFTDIQSGAVWEFRHVYRGAPKRHLLTTGWSKFVNNKRLIAGDSVVFMKTLAGDQLFIGVRRAPVSSYDQGDEYNESNGGVAEKDDGSESKEFRRTGEGRLTASAVSEAMLNAARGRPFEVVYYPTAGWSEFVVRAEDVESSMPMPCTPGARVKMAIKTDDPSKITSIQGIVSSINYPSHWKPLQITWDEPEKLQNVKRVNLWQVKIVANATQRHATCPPGQMLKCPQTLFERGESSAAAPDSRPYSFSNTTVPDGMQGARHYENGSYNPRQSSAAAPDQRPYSLSNTTVPDGMQGARHYENGSYNPRPYSFSNTTVPDSMQGARHYENGSYNPRQSSSATPDPTTYSFSNTRVPAGMQGVRHYEFGSARFIGENPPQLLTNVHFRPRPQWGKVSTEMNFGSLSSDDLSPNSNSTNLSAKAKPVVLFGNIITRQEPSESGLAGSGLCEKDGSKESSDNETEIDFFAGIYKVPSPK